MINSITHGILCMRYSLIRKILGAAWPVLHFAPLNTLSSSSYTELHLVQRIKGCPNRKGCGHSIQFLFFYFLHEQTARDMPWTVFCMFVRLLGGGREPQVYASIWTIILLLCRACRSSTRKILSLLYLIFNLLIWLDKLHQYCSMHLSWVMYLLLSNIFKLSVQNFHWYNLVL